MTRFFYPNIIVFAMILMSHLHAAEIYKWTDKDGKVHFSQKKPQHSKTLESFITKNNNAFVEIETLKAVKKPTANQLRHLLVIRPDDFWLLKKADKKTTTYYFGGDCVSPVKKTFQEMKANQPYLMPRVSALIDYIIKPIIKLNYSVSSSRLQPLKHNVARYEQPLVLAFSLDDIKYDLCAVNLSRQYRNKLKINSGSEPFDFTTSEYSRRRVYIRLNWQLTDPNSGKILYEGKTKGSANHWSRDIQQYQLKTIKSAMEVATSNLFANPNFVKLFTPQVAEPKKSLKKKRITKTEKNDLLDSFKGLFRTNAIKKAELAKVFSELSVLKIMMVEFYMIEGQWPKRLSDLRATRVGLFDESYVSKVEFDYDGAIVLSLDSQKFGQGSMLSLKPKDYVSGGRIEWSCLTNLGKEYYGNYCTRIE